MVDELNLTTDGEPLAGVGVLRVEVEILGRAKLQLNPPGIHLKFLGVGFHPLLAILEEVLSGHKACVLNVVVEARGGGISGDRRADRQADV